MMKDLLDFHERLKFDDIPIEVVAQAKRCFLDWVGVTLGAMSHPATKLMMETLLEFGGFEQASVLGTSVRTSVHHAALINGTASHVLDYDDTHLGALMHPSVTIIPAILALGESRNVSGRQFLLSYLAGFEIETRISMAMGSMHYDAGWHATATMGRFGAAAASAKLLGLDGKQTANALGLAGTQASGIRKVFGTMTKSFHPGKAAADGLLSALLAAKGFTCSEDILSGEKGLGALLSSDYNPARALDGLGRSYNIMGISIKPFASCLYTHPTIDGLIYLRGKFALTPGRVKRILCKVSGFCVDAACQKNPQTGLAAKFSTYYCAALAVADGKAGESGFAQARVHDPLLRELMDRVEVEAKPGLSDSEAEILVELTDGRTLEHKVPFPLGHPAKPLTDTDVEEKFRDLVCDLLDPRQIGTVLGEVQRLDEMSDIARLLIFSAGNISTNPS